MYVCVYMGRCNAAARVVGVRSLLAQRKTWNLQQNVWQIDSDNIVQWQEVRNCVFPVMKLSLP